MRKKVAEGAQFLVLEMENIEINNVVPVPNRYKASCENNLIDILSMLNDSEDEGTDDG